MKWYCVVKTISFLMHNLSGSAFPSRTGALPTIYRRCGDKQWRDSIRPSKNLRLHSRETGSAQISSPVHAPHTFASALLGNETCCQGIDSGSVFGETFGSDSNTETPFRSREKQSHCG